MANSTIHSASAGLRVTAMFGGTTIDALADPWLGVVGDITGPGAVDGGGMDLLAG